MLKINSSVKVYLVLKVLVLALVIVYIFWSDEKNTSAILKGIAIALVGIVGVFVAFRSNKRKQ